MTAFYCNGEKYLYVQQIYFLWRFYVGLFDGICVGVSHKCAFKQKSDFKETQMPCYLFYVMYTFSPRLTISIFMINR